LEHHGAAEAIVKETIVLTASDGHALPAYHTTLESAPM
jgi:hypothetical protein